MFALPLYIISLTASSCVVGLFVRRILASQGYAPDFQTGLVLALSAALAFMALQLVYMAFVRFVTPYRGPMPFMAEIASHLSALILIPFFLGVAIPWPDLGSDNIHRLLVKAEPFAFIGAFVAAHAFFKLLALFGATQSRPASRIPAVAWAGAGAGCFLGAAGVFGVWQTALVEARTSALEERRHHQVGDAWAFARHLQEGYFYPIDLAGHGGKSFVIHWAATGQDDAVDEISVTLRFDTAAVAPLFLETSLEAGRWNTLRIPGGLIPEEVSAAQIRWSGAGDNALLARTGIQPVNPSDRVLLAAGPYYRLERQSEALSFLVLLLDGVGGEHLRSLDYDRDPAPNLDAFAAESLSYRYAYTPAPEAPAAATSLLSGYLPLAHGVLGDRSGPLPESMPLLPALLQEAGYATAAFTEGDNGGGLNIQSAIANAFELFDDSYPLIAARRSGGGALPGGVEPPSPARTLSKALAHLREQQGVPSFTFVRLRELEEIRPLARHATPFPAQRRNRLPIDEYDNGLHSLDNLLQAFFEDLDEEGILDHTAVVITSPYGFTFSGNEGGTVTLAESSLRVPLILRSPREPARQRLGLAGLEDIPPTLLRLAGLPVPQGMTGESLLEWNARDRIAVQGDPLALSLRTKDWRLTWDSGRSPFTLSETGSAAIRSMINMDRYRLGRPQENYVETQPAAAEGLVERLHQYLMLHPDPLESAPASTTEAAAPSGDAQAHASR